MQSTVTWQQRDHIRHLRWRCNALPRLLNPRLLLDLQPATRILANCAKLGEQPVSRCADPALWVVLRGKRVASAESDQGANRLLYPRRIHLAEHRPYVVGRVASGYCRRKQSGGKQCSEQSDLERAGLSK